MISVEAVMVSILLTVIVALAFMHAVNTLAPQRPTISWTKIDAVLCGRVLIVKNVGDKPAIITKIKGIKSGVEHDVLSVPITLGPGEYRPFRHLQDVYDRVVIVGENFESVVVENACVGG